MRYRGLTWDHPRGYSALMAAARLLDESRDGISISWDKHSLEGFEAHPIGDLCARYDLVVFDHPHVGEAVAAGCLQPLESLFTASEIVALEQDTIGPCLSSYRFNGLHWGLPLDAATQVLAYRADLHAGPPPVTWDDVIALSEREPVALSLAGPHAALSFQSIVAALSHLDDASDTEQFVPTQTGLAALDILARLAARSPRVVRDANPIGILSHMATHDDVVLCPLIYGYVNYAVVGAGVEPGVSAARAEAAAARPNASAGGGAGSDGLITHPVSFANAPRETPGGRPGSTLGGTGIGISTRCVVTPELLSHLRWLMSAEAQTHFIPAHDGQPSRRSAWMDDAVNSRWGNFYRNTAATLERAHVRPRHNHAIAFQTGASAFIREALENKREHRAALAGLQSLFASSGHDRAPPRPSHV
jgi:multiple sugar transport system substrate-binding protein